MSAILRNSSKFLKILSIIRVQFEKSMEQGSPGRRLLASSSNNDELIDLTNELNPIVHSFIDESSVLRELNPRNEIETQNLESSLMAFQIPQTPHIGTPFPVSPLAGDQFIAQFQGTNEGLSGMYNMPDNSFSHDPQLFQISNGDEISVPPNAIVPHDAWYNSNDIMNFAGLSLPNYPSEYPSFSTILEGENNGSSQNQEMTVGSSIIVHPLVNVDETYSTPQAQTSLVIHGPSFSSHSLRIYDNVPNPMNVQGGWDGVAGGSSSHSKGPDLSGQKRKMVWEDDNTPSYQSLNPSFGRYQRYSSSMNDNEGSRYKLYDRRYEAIGLPVDPHLRIFNANKGNEKRRIV
ncbi:hypothetical protein CASFOL_003693 [Castilleja foliolosa]|uniref:Uncharacterized protein n=1 Tax=Castilleja foliolosa TaxID=1961234 RepID=A0ABD3EIG0_9LAMI